VNTLRIPTAKVFQPLLAPARYKGAFGGRGSAKSHFFGELLVEQAEMAPGHNGGAGLLAVCIREVQKTLGDSSKRLVENKIVELGLGHRFKVWRDRIETPGDGTIIFQGMADHTAESIKSLEGFRTAWIDEAQTLSARSLSLLRPTIRAPGSEIWASWNPRRKSDAIDDFLRARKPEGAIVVESNWRNNPWFPKELEDERQLDLKLYPERYDHIWEGGYAKAFEGAYFAGVLAEAKLKGRIVKNLSADPLLPLRAFHDLGGSSANADAFTIWIVQWVGDEIRVLDYYETVGQVLAHHVNWMRKGGYEDAINYLPHDGARPDGFVGKRYEDHWRDAGFNVMSIKNQGSGAASIRIEAIRRLGPKMWFDEEKTEAGREAIGFYHEKRDPERNIGLGPEHDWSSHAADSLGLMACCYEPPAQSANFGRKINYGDSGWR
jgi:phage terminase large subunit